MSTIPHPCAAGPWIPGTEAVYIPTPHKDVVSGGPSSGVYIIVVQNYEYPVTARVVDFYSGRWWVAEVFESRRAVRLVDVLWFAEIQEPT